MIRVALHVIAGPQGGPKSYGVHLAQALSRTGGISLTVLTDRPEAFPGIECVALPRVRTLSDTLLVPALLRRLRPDVYHNTKNVLPPFVPCPSVVTVHDLACHHFPETFGAAAGAYLRFQTARAVRRATRVVAVSHHARRDLEATLGVPEAKISVIYHGIGDLFLRAPAARADPPAKPCVLSVGTIQPRKNLDILVRAAALVRERGGIDFTLAIAGRRGWKTGEFEEACRTTPVDLLGSVPDEALPALYANAAVFVQPSSYEGFGLTMVEAMACGAPVIAAEAGSLPEIAGAAALLVRPRDEVALADAIGKVLGNPGLARELSAAGRERSRLFRWERSAREHASLYEEIARKAVVA